MRRPGERGKQGDHGQAGDPGQRGEVGNSGERGTTGDTGETGARGVVGPRGATGRSRLDRTQLAVYLFIILIGAYGFYQSEQNDRESMEQRTVICQRQVESREAIRQVYRDVATLGRSLLDNPDTTPERRAVLEQRFSQFEQERLAEYPPIKAGCLEGGP